MTPAEREELTRRLEVLDDRLVTSLVRLIAGEVDAIQLPNGWRIIIDPNRPRAEVKP